MQIELFDARMLAPLASFLERSGIRSEPLLDRARIPTELVAEGGWIGKKQAYDFTFDAVRRSDCPQAVYSAYLAFEFEHLGPIAAAMTACKTVKESLEVGLRLGGTAYEGNEYFLQVDGDTTWMCYRELRTISAGQTFINDMTLAVYVQLIRALVDENWRPEQALLRCQVNGRHRSVAPFEQCEARPHHDVSALAIPTEFLSRRLPERLQQAHSEQENGWRFGPEGSEPVVERLYRLLASNFASRKLPTLDQVAMMVDVSPATLKRQLQAVGSNYSALVDRLRFDQACEMLATPHLRVRDIASELGYSGTSNFVRGFRRMTGKTPAAYRRQRLGQLK